MLFIIKTFLITTLLGLGALSHAQERDSIDPLLGVILSDSVLAEGEEIIKTLLQKYPSDKHAYVFVGRSLSVIQIQMEAKGHSTLALPISGKGFHPEAPSQAMQNLNENLLMLTDKHLGGLSKSVKKIVLIDYSVSGLGIKAAKKLLDYFFQEQKKIIRFEVMTRDLASNTKAFRRLFEKDYVYRLKKGSKFAEHLRRSNFDFLAPHPSFIMSSGQLKDHTSPENDQYRRAALNLVLHKKNKAISCLKFLN